MTRVLGRLFTWNGKTYFLWKKNNKKNNNHNNNNNMSPAAVVKGGIRIKAGHHNPAKTQRRYNVAATPRRCSDVVMTLLWRCVFTKNMLLPRAICDHFMPKIHVIHGTFLKPFFVGNFDTLQVS